MVRKFGEYIQHTGSLAAGCDGNVIDSYSRPWRRYAVTLVTGPAGLFNREVIQEKRRGFPVMEDNPPVGCAGDSLESVRILWADDREGWSVDDIHRWGRFEVLVSEVHGIRPGTGPGEESSWSGRKDEFVRDREGDLDTADTRR